MEEHTETKKGISTLSKKKYFELAEAFHKELNDSNQTERLLTILKDVMNFDPDVSRYTPEVGRQIRDRIQRLKEQGVSTYVSSGRKTSYHNKKIQNVMA